MLFVESKTLKQTVNSATRDSTARRVVLRTSPLAEDTTYTLTVSGIHDETGTIGCPDRNFAKTG